jgi:hypothetical protein
MHTVGDVLAGRAEHTGRRGMHMEDEMLVGAFNAIQAQPVGIGQ